MAVDRFLKGWQDAKAANWKVLLYGFPGAGKTTLAAGFPNSLVIETDIGGHVVLNSPKFEHMRWIQIRTFKGLVNFIRELEKDKATLNSIDTVVLDTWSEVQQLQRLEEADGDILADGWLFNQAIYARSNTRLNKLLQELLSLGKNTVIVSHLNEEMQGEGTSARTIIRPAISNEPRKALLANLDGVFFMREEGKKRILTTKTGSATMTKSRFPSMPDVMLDPTAEKLLPFLNAIVKEKEKPSE